jgi:hypothetical protein
MAENIAICFVIGFYSLPSPTSSMVSAFLGFVASSSAKPSLDLLGAIVSTKKARRSARPSGSTFHLSALAYQAVRFLAQAVRFVPWNVSTRWVVLTVVTRFVRVMRTVL